MSILVLANTLHRLNKPSLLGLNPHSLVMLHILTDRDNLPCGVFSWVLSIWDYQVGPIYIYEIKWSIEKVTIAWKPQNFFQSVQAFHVLLLFAYGLHVDIFFDHGSTDLCLVNASMENQQWSPQLKWEHFRWRYTHWNSNNLGPTSWSAVSQAKTERMTTWPGFFMCWYQHFKITPHHFPQNSPRNYQQQC